MTIEMEELRRLIEGLSRHPQTRRYTPELRARVLAWAKGRRAEGASVATLCGEIGIGEPTLRKLLEPGERRASRKKAAGFARVKVVAPAPKMVLVRGPGGLVVEGLSLEGVAELMRRLACSA